MLKTRGKKTWFDIALIAALLLLSGILLLVTKAGQENGARVIVRVDGQQTAVYSLSDSGTYPLNGGTNILVIESGRAWLTDADCPDKLCVKQGVIQYTGQCITCLPNKLTVTVYGNDNGIDVYIG